MPHVTAEPEGPEPRLDVPAAAPPVTRAAGPLSGGPAAVSALGLAAGNRALARALLARDLSSDYDDAVRRADWRAAAEYLNGFNRADIVRRLRARTTAEWALLHQGALANPRVGGQAQVALLTPPLLTRFAAQFRDAAELVLGSTEAMTLVREGVAAGVLYGGFSEDGPGRTSPGAIPYTVGNTIYVPRARLTDRVLAMKGFLFEINNAVRAPRFAAVSRSAAEGRINAAQYARSMIELEVEGMLRMGSIWSAIKASMGGGAALDAYDATYYLAEHRDVAAGRRTAADIATDVGNRRYTAGANVGMTVTDYYVAAFNRHYARP